MDARGERRGAGLRSPSPPAPPPRGEGRRWMPGEGPGARVCAPPPPWGEGAGGRGELHFNQSPQPND